MSFESESLDRRETDKISSSFDKLIPQVSSYYDFPELKEADLHYSFEDRSPNLRSFAIQTTDSRRKPVFVAYMPDYFDFTPSFSSMMNDSEYVRAYGAGIDGLARDIYVGCGLVQPVIEEDVKTTVLRKPKTGEDIRNFFFDKAPIEELFVELFPPGHEEIDPVWALSRHIGDVRTAEVNKIRAQLEYFWCLIDGRHGEGLHAEVVDFARKAIVRQMTVEERPFYLNLGVLGFKMNPQSYEQDPEKVCNEVFMDRMSEWLIAMALPMDTGLFRPKDN